MTPTPFRTFPKIHPFCQPDPSLRGSTFLRDYVIFSRRVEVFLAVHLENKNKIRHLFSHHLLSHCNALSNVQCPMSMSKMIYKIMLKKSYPPFKWNVISPYLSCGRVEVFDFLAGPPSNHLSAPLSQLLSVALKQQSFISTTTLSLSKYEFRISSFFS